jgi:hypothetical protein
MASRYTVTEPVRMWNILAEVLSYGHTIPFLYKKDVQRFNLRNGPFGWGGYHDESSAEYLLEDIQHALFSEGQDKVELQLSGKEDGPICSVWTFTFTKAGLVSAYSYYNDD